MNTDAIFNPTNWTRTFTDEGTHFHFRTTEGDLQISITAGDTRRAAVKTRVYIDGEEPVDFTEAERLSRGAGTYQRGECLEADKAWDAGNRQVIKNKKARAAELINELPLIAELLDGVKLSFNRKAGCSCGCSAGFIADRVIRATAIVPSWRKGEVEERYLPIKAISVWTAAKA